MMYLALEIVLWLVAAALIGFFAGWLIRSALRRDTGQAASEAAMAARLTAAEADFEARMLAADAAVARLKAELHVATTRADTVEGEVKRRFGELETALKQEVLTAEAKAADSSHALEKTRNMFSTAEREWSHRAGTAHERAAEAERGLASLTAELDAMRSAASQDTERASQISALSAERDALMAERDALRERLAAAESRPAPAPRKPRAKALPPAEGDPAAPAKAPVRRRRATPPPESEGGES